MILYGLRLLMLLTPLSVFAVPEVKEQKEHKKEHNEGPVGAERVLIVPELSPCQSPLKGEPSCSQLCPFSEWERKITMLKERPIEFSTLPPKDKYQKSIITLREFMGAMQAAAKAMAESTCNNNAWLGKRSLYSTHPEQYTLYRPFSEPAASVKNFPFKPYVRKLIVRPGSELIMFGDLHGSVHSLIRDVKKLKDEGFIDDSFKIVKDNSYIVFLGDYIDRGIYGVEVMYTLARLVIANPTKVLIARGNHEDYILAPDFRKKHTKAEEKDNAPSLIDELYLKFDLTLADEVALFRFYEILPLAVFIGCGTTSQIDFIQCCHGGLEIGYNPHKLLNADKSIAFERITTLFRRKHFSENLSNSARSMITKAFSSDLLDDDIQDIKPNAPFFAVGTTGHIAYNGFMWNDFYVDPAKTVGQRGDKKFTGWVYGRTLAKELLSWGNSKKVTLRGVMRGHQHNNETGGPMLNLLCCARGIVDVWKDRTVYTLVSAPDSKLEDTGENCFTYDSFVIVTTASNFNDWKIRHYVQDNGMSKKEWTMKQLALNTTAAKRAGCPTTRRSQAAPKAEPMIAAAA